MMYQSMRGIGDATSASAIALANPPSMSLMPSPPTTNANANLDWCEWCATSPYLSAFNPNCYNLNEQICSPIVVAYLKAGAPAAPPSQDVINSQTPDQTINDIVTQSHVNAVAAAVEAAATQPPYTSGVCAQNDPQYNAILCWLKDNAGMLEVGGIVAGMLWLISTLAKRH